jgi:hypothetical protein
MGAYPQSTRSAARADVFTQPARPPVTYATRERLADYLAAMQRRQEAPAERPALVYFAATPQLRGARRATVLDAVRRQLPGVRMVTFADVFAPDDPRDIGARYRQGWEAFADRLHGLVVYVPRSGTLGPALTREIRTVVRRRLPVLVTADGRPLAALLDCRLSRVAHPSPYRALSIDLPAAGPALPSVAASLRALGVAR